MSVEQFIAVFQAVGWPMGFVLCGVALVIWVKKDSTPGQSTIVMPGGEPSPRSNGHSGDFRELRELLGEFRSVLTEHAATLRAIRESQGHQATEIAPVLDMVQELPAQIEEVRGEVQEVGAKVEAVRLIILRSPGGPDARAASAPAPV